MIPTYESCVLNWFLFLINIFYKIFKFISVIMFLQSSERVLYYPSIGKSDKIKNVSCSINTDNTKYIF